MLYLDSLLELANFQESPAVSIFIPAQDVLKMKQTLTTVLKKLGSSLSEHLTKAETTRFLEPVSALLTTPTFWQNRQSGLAIFRGITFFMVIHTPHEVPQKTIVNSHFHLLPLIPYFEQSQLFHILDLSLASPAIYEANAFFFRALHLNLQNTHWKQEVLALLHKTQTPLILAGTAKAQTDFLANTNYPLCSPIIFSPPANSLSHQEALQKTFLKHIKHLLEANKQKAWQELQRLQNSGQTLTNIREIANAAYNSRIETLFVNTEVIPAQKADPEGINESQKLVNMATSHTLLNGGWVYALSSQQQGPVAAIARY